MTSPESVLDARSAAAEVNSEKWPAFAIEQHIGRSRERNSLEDRAFAGVATTARGLTLLVAMVADGIGGGNFGERAAQLALDTAFETIAQATASKEEHIARLLKLTLTRANAAVHQEAQENKRVLGMGATGVIIAVHQERLYLANAGDSRAYLIRDGRVIQLTHDHTWAYEMVRLGRLSPEQAANHPKAGELTRSLGYQAEVEVDLALHLQEDESEESAQQNQGTPLRAGDRLVLCSDGLVKPRHDVVGHYVEPAEIRRTVTRHSPDKAARELVELALRREVDDNVSVIVLEMPGSKRALYIPRAGWYALAVLPVLLCLGVVVAAIAAGRDNGVTQAQPTPLPTLPPGAESATPTQVPPPESGLAIILEAGSQAEADIHDGQGFFLIGGLGEAPVSAGATFRSGADIMELLLADSTHLYLAPNSEVEVQQVYDPGAIDETRLLLRSGLLVVDREGEAGHALVVADSNNNRARVGPGQALAGLSLDPSSRELAIDCLAAGCALAGAGGVETNLAAGQRAVAGPAGLVGEVQPARNELYIALTERVATPTATSTITPSATPTETPTATSTRRPTSTPSPTRTPVPPTVTPIPPTVTPVPTVAPPTATSTVEPTDIPPPTDTPQPTMEPTSTPATIIPRP